MDIEIIQLNSTDLVRYGEDIFTFLDSRREINDFSFYSKDQYQNYIENCFKFRDRFSLGITLFENRTIGYFESFIVNGSIILNLEIEPVDYDPKIVYEILKQLKTFYNRNLTITIQIRDQITSEIDTFLPLKRRLNNINYRVECKDIDLKILQLWKDEAIERNPGIYFKIYNKLPDSLLDSYLQLLKESMDDIPQEELRVEFNITIEDIQNEEEYHIRMGSTPYYILIFDRDNSLIAIANGIINQNYPYSCKQFMSGVKRGFRGRGLSKLLKSLSISHIVESDNPPKYITTGTNIDNLPIIKISEAIGMRKTSVRKEYVLESR